MAAVVSSEHRPVASESTNSADRTELRGVPPEEILLDEIIPTSRYVISGPERNTRSPTLVVRSLTSLTVKGKTTWRSK